MKWIYSSDTFSFTGLTSSSNPTRSKNLLFSNWSSTDSTIIRANNMYINHHIRFSNIVYFWRWIQSS
ncbi:hypothetical protein Patl1_01698 [Pistacia atlantica]|uniref:Uncharacterized protein n=1 Tax=Pistacia atlantica TaxID=434234 RepID=A0ACC1C8V5_9ROSI|nr:hypothetical protein Patl1_01698 [Pistacia atlantica]